MAQQGRRTAVSIAVSTVCAAALVFGLAQSSSAGVATSGVFFADSAAATEIQAREDALSLIAQRIENVADFDDEGAGADPVDTPSATVKARQAAVLATDEQLAAERVRLAEMGKFFFPAEGQVGSPWGPRYHPILHYVRNHDGVDIGAACGSPIWATLPGTVTAVGVSGEAGLRVKIDHGEVGGKHMVTGYLHMSKADVAVGDVIERGQQIGEVGNTGLSTSCHLHLALWVDEVNVDPVPYLNA